MQSVYREGLSEISSASTLSHTISRVILLQPSAAQFSLLHLLNFSELGRDSVVDYKLNRTRIVLQPTCWLQIHCRCDIPQHSAMNRPPAHSGTHIVAALPAVLISGVYCGWYRLASACLNLSDEALRLVHGETC
jgi:hypothetical protein